MPSGNRTPTIATRSDPYGWGWCLPTSIAIPVGYLLVCAVEALARRPCTVISYSNRVAAPDDFTTRFQMASALWCDTAGLKR